MDRLEHARDWLDARRELAFEIARIFLGFALFAQGIYFVGHVGDVRELLARGGVNLDFTLAVALSHYVALAHLAGGFMLMLGVATRLAAAIQVPVLLGAVFLVHLREGLFGASQGLQLSVLVLVMLLLCVAHGGGKLSLDEYLRTHVRWATDEGQPHW
jgi:putative oxidoreductase